MRLDFFDRVPLSFQFFFGPDDVDLVVAGAASVYGFVTLFPWNFFLGLLVFVAGNWDQMMIREVHSVSFTKDAGTDAH